MEEASRPDSLQLLIRLYRSLRGWGQAELAAEAGLDPSSIYRYEAGVTEPPPETRERLAEAAGLARTFVEGILLPALEAARAGTASFSEETFADLERSAAEIDRALAGTGRSAIALLLQELEKADREPWELSGPPAAADRLVALDAWNRLEDCTAEDRRFLVEACREFQIWSLAELLCHKSLQAAAGAPEEALKLAELACRIAELAPGEETWRSRLQGYAWAHVGSARKTCREVAGAEEAHERSRRLWQAGAAGDPGLLDEAVMLEIEESWRLAS
jgi:transcriptional regulator with XRE-family HTH domain